LVFAFPFTKNATSTLTPAVHETAAKVTAA
jgi:hypothetical protein